MQNFLVATLSGTQNNAKLIQQIKSISAVQLNKFYLDNKPDIEIHTIQQINQVLNIDSTMPIPSTQNIVSLATQNPISKLTIERNRSFTSDNAVQVCFSQKKIVTCHANS